MPRKMKESGVEWLGQIPEGWELRRGKTFLRLLSRIVEDTDDVITCFRDGEVTLRKNRREEGFTNALKECGYQGVEPGDLVVHGMDGFAGAIGISDSRGKASPVLNVMDTDENKRFVMYYLRVMAMCDVFLALSTGIRVRSCDLRWNKLGDLEYLLPPRSEQQQIAAFLDERCAKIDGMIAEAKASIEDYKKWKQSIIFETVTGKHEKNLKPSGVDWIGDVPEGWKVCRLKNVASVFGRIGFRGYTTEDLVAEGDGAISLSPSNLKDMYMDFSKRTYISWAKYEESPEIKVAEGDIVFVKTGSSYGKSCLVRGLPEKATLNPQLVVIKNISCNNDFLHYVLQTPFIRYQVELIVSGGTIPTMSQEKMGRFSFVLPSKNVQHRIAAELDEKCAAIDKLVGEKESLIADLEAYKKSLIFETVTGKREVEKHEE